jgi:two-component system heavy metal sensor histidine kinase CusS
VKRHPLQIRLTVWFASSVLTVGLLFALITYFHLRHELRFEQWQRVHPDNPDFVLHGTYSDAEIDDIAGHILHISLLISLPVAGISLLLGRYLARKSLRPLVSINDQLQQIEAKNLNARILTPDADIELETITRNINALLERIERSYSDVSEFSARVAHELRTPLTLMRLQLEDSSESIEPSLSEGLQEELQHLESYVDQCLLIARAERGLLEATYETIHLPSLIEDVLEPFSLLAKEENRHLRWEEHRHLPIEAVPWIIRQILHNLLGNALKHGQGDIDLSLESSPQGMVLSVSNPCKNEKTDSTGIGLRMVEALVRSHGSLSHVKTVENGTYTARLIFDPSLERNRSSATRATLPGESAPPDA